MTVLMNEAFLKREGDPGQCDAAAAHRQRMITLRGVYHAWRLRRHGGELLKSARMYYVVSVTMMRRHATRLHEHAIAVPVHSISQVRRTYGSTSHSLHNNIRDDHAVKFK